MTGADLPLLRAPVPGPRCREHIDRLAVHESPGVTARRARRAAAIGSADFDPIVFAEAVGANVRDADGNLYVDLTSGFGVAFVGHRHPAVVDAVREQTGRLLHAMGDAFPDVTRVALLERLAEVAPEGLDVAILGLSGSDAVDCAVKTAVLATGRTGVLAFNAGYHGLALGVVAVQGYKPAFTRPFAGVAHPAVTHLPWNAPLADVEAALSSGDIGLVIAEPVQGRGGMRPAAPGWHRDVATAARTAGALFAFDEIQTGLGRTGAWFAGTEEGVVPDLLCLGKALGGGVPLSACLGTREVMNAWGASTGEALHTQTFLGHPVGCAAALAVLELLETQALPARASQVGDRLRGRIEALGLKVRGRGLMLGVELGARSLAACRSLLHRGFLVLPAGQQADVIGLTPPVCLTDEQADAFVAALAEVAA